MFDGELMFDKKRAISATAPSTNVIDIKRDIGTGVPLYLTVIGTPATGAGTLAIEYQEADGGTMAGAATVATFKIANAVLLKGGVILSAPLPPNGRKFVRLNYVFGGTLTGLQITAGITMGQQWNK